MGDVSEANLDALLQQGLHGQGPLKDAFNKMAVDEQKRLTDERAEQQGANQARGYIVNPTLTDEEIKAAVNAKLEHEAGKDSALRVSLIKATEGDVGGALTEAANVGSFIKAATSIPEMLLHGDLPGVLNAVKEAIENSKSGIAFNSLGEFRQELDDKKIHSLGDIIDFFKEKIFEGKEKEALEKLGTATGFDPNEVHKALHSDTPLATPSNNAPAENHPSMTTTSQPFNFGQGTHVSDEHGMNLKTPPLPSSLTKLLTTPTRR